MLTLQEFTDIYKNAISPDLPGFDVLYPAASDDRAVEKLYAVTAKLIENGKKFNLTSILEPAEIVRKHLIDSLIPLGLLQGTGIPFASVLDIGTGGGFPLMPMACVAPDVSFMGMDSTAKKISHIRETAEFAGMTNVSAIAGRAEELAHGELRQSFDLVCARAVASLPVLIELCGGFVTPGGHFCALKSHVEEELEAADRAGKVLGLTNIALIDYEIPGGDTRCLVIYRKTAPTPAKYPRRYAEITKRALS